MTPQDEKRFYETLGSRIKAARKKNPKLSQEKLAKMIDMSRPSVVNIEQGRQRIHVHILYQLANALKVSLSELIPTRFAVQQPLSEEIISNLTEKERVNVSSVLSLVNDEEVTLDVNQHETKSSRTVGPSKSKETSNPGRKNRKTAPN